MELDNILEAENRLKDAIKKNCMLCMARAGLVSNKKENPNKQITLEASEKLYNVYEMKYDALRARNSGADAIQNANANRRSVRDMKDECINCDRTIDRAKRAVLILK